MDVLFVAYTNPRPLLLLTGALPARRLGVHRRWGGDTAGTAIPDWPERGSPPWDVMPSKKSWGKEGAGGLSEWWLLSSQVTVRPDEPCCPGNGLLMGSCAKTQQKDNCASHSITCLLFSIFLFPIFLFAILMLVCFAQNDDEVLRNQCKLERKRAVTLMLCYTRCHHTTWSKPNASVSDEEICWTEHELCVRCHCFSGSPPKVEFLRGCISMYAWTPAFPYAKQMYKLLFVIFKV